MPIITKVKERLLVKTPTNIETTSPNTTALERMLVNRIIISETMPTSPMLGDLWKNISVFPPLQLQCVSVDPLEWDDFLEPPYNWMELSELRERVTILEYMCQMLGLSYTFEEFDQLLVYKADILHDHSGWWQPHIDYLDAVEVQLVNWEQMFTELARA